MAGASDTFPLSKFNEISSLHIKPLFNYLKEEISASELQLGKAAVFESSLSNPASSIQAPLQKPGGGMPPLQLGDVQQERQMRTLQPTEMPETQSQLSIQQKVQDQRAWQAQIGAQTGRFVYPQMQNLDNPFEFPPSFLAYQGIQAEQSHQMGHAASKIQAPLQEPRVGMTPLQGGYRHQEREMQTLQPTEMSETQSQLSILQKVQDQRAWQAQVGSQTGSCFYPQMQNLQNPFHFKSPLAHQGIRGEKSQQVGQARMPTEKVNEEIHHQELRGSIFKLVVIYF